MSTTFQSRPVFDIRPDFSGISSGVLDDFTFAPLSVGAGTPWKVTAGPRRTIRYSFAFDGREAINSFRLFFSDRKGRREGFWLPVYLLDYSLNSNAAVGASTIAIKSVGLASTLATFSRFGFLVLADWERMECAKISSVVLSSGVETITLTAPLAQAWTAGKTICGGLIIARASDDAIEYDHSSAVTCRTSVKFVELPAEYSVAHAGSAPVLLYEFTRAGSVWRYADSAADLYLDAKHWAGGDLTIGDMASGLEAVTDSVQLTVATDDATHPLRALLDRNTMAETFVAIYETDLDTLTIDTSAPVYKGRVEDFSGEDKGKLTCKLSSILRVSEMIGPRIVTQRTCNHRFGDEFCTLNLADWTTAGTISAISTDPAYVESVAFGTKAGDESDPNWFALGRVTVGTEQRLCVGESGDRLYLNAPFKSAIVGAAISATAGDDRRAGTCSTKFDNVVNFLGTPYMPNKSAQFEAIETPSETGGKGGGKGG